MELRDCAVTWSGFCLPMSLLALLGFWTEFLASASLCHRSRHFRTLGHTLECGISKWQNSIWLPDITHFPEIPNQAVTPWEGTLFLPPFGRSA